MTYQATSRSPGIDALRAIFALWVMLLAHLIPWTRSDIAILTPLSNWLKLAFQSGAPQDLPTNPAVLAFIVLSGYCIHKSGLRGSIAAYAIRRVFRIYPIYVAATLFGLAASAFCLWYSPEAASKFSLKAQIHLECLATKLTSSASFQPLHSRGVCRYYGNGPLNTVMAEIALYVAYPILLVGIGRRWPRLMWAAILGIWSAVFVLAWWEPRLRWWWNNASVYGFLLYWWLGAALVEPRIAAIARSRSALLLSAGALVLLVAYSLQNDTLGILTIEARKLALAAVTCCLIARHDQIGRWLRGLAPLGEAGYSLYAFHAPICYTMLIIGFPWWMTAAATIIFAFVSFRLFEHPIDAYGRRLAISRSATPSLAIPR